MSGEDVDAYMELKYEDVRNEFQNTRLNHLIHSDTLIIIHLVIILSSYINALFNTQNFEDSVF
jgi:hypothetical protein